MFSNDTRLARRIKPAPLALGLALGLAMSSLAVAQSPSTLPKLKTAVAFPNLKFDRPVALAYPNDGSKLLFVVEQHQTAKSGRSRTSKKTSDKQDSSSSLPDPISRRQRGRAPRPGVPPQVQAERRVLRLLLGRRQQGRQGAVAALRRLAVQGLQGRPAQGRPQASEERIWVSRPRSRSATTTAAASSSDPTASSTSRSATAARGATRSAPARTPPTGGARSSASTSTTPPTASPTASPSDNPKSKGGA